MKKTTIFLMLFSLFCATITLTSCDKKSIRSVSRMKKDERKIIAQFIDENNIKVKTASDKQTEFDPNIMYIMPNGLYMQVLDKGNEERAVENKTHIYIRLKGEVLDPKAPANRKLDFNSLSSGKYQPIEFIYRNYYQQGEIHFELINPDPGYNLTQYMCEGLAYPMSLLGNHARAKLIIPFVIGPDFLYESGNPVYVEEVEYTFR
ncbi:DUF4827 family protein [Falsiporphyromonas endometrii]|uniref:DUF4827 family protein n=1 Tax=Falsiporphyromonas endometrii TaxID=1387297 RepID=A0ABV9K5B1_9PORP|nr:DUF4827 family protein [Porphyromonadaceae bacterium]